MTTTRSSIRKKCVAAGVALVALAALLAIARRESPDLLRERIAAIYASHFPALIGVSPGGDKLLFKGISARGFDLQAVDRITRASTMIDSSADGALQPVWSRDGRYLAYFEDDAGKDQSRIRIFDFESKRAKTLDSLPTASTVLAWSPDNAMIAYSVATKRKRGLALIRPFDEPRENRMLEENLSFEANFVFSSDSRSVIYVSGAEPAAIRVLDLDGSLPPRSIAVPGKVRQLQWLPRSRRIAAALMKDGAEFPRLYEIDAVSGAIEELPATPPGDITDLEASSDGESIFFTLVNGINTSVFVYHRRDGSNARLMEWDGGAGLMGPAANPDLAYVYIAREFGARFIVAEMNLRDGSTREIDSQAKGDMRNVSCQEVSIPVEWRTVNGLYWSAPQPGPQRSLAIMLHGGPRANYTERWRAESQALLENGIDILQLNYSGSSGYGRSFAEGVHNAVTDTLATFEYAHKILRYPESRVFLWGYSYGASLAIEAADKLADRAGGVVLFNYLGNATDTGNAPRVMLAFHGEHDYLTPPADALKSLKRHWGLDERARPPWWHVLRAEGHSLRRIPSWTEALATVIRAIGQNGAAQ